MELNQDELQASIEAAGTRYKWLRSQLTEGGLPSTEKDKKEASLTALNSVIKKLLEYQKEHFPEAQDSEPADIEEELIAESVTDYSAVRVLIADDDGSERTQIKRYLLAEGFADIDESNDGHTAIAAIKGKSMPYDLVICDYKMPTISGLDVLRLVRQEEKYSDMPFIMISNQGSKQIIEETMTAGVNAYLVKPITAENLMPKVTRILNPPDNSEPSETMDSTDNEENSAGSAEPESGGAESESGGAESESGGAESESGGAESESGDKE